MLIYKLRNYTITTQYLQEVQNRRRVVYYAILLIIILGELLEEINYIIVRFLEYDKESKLTTQLLDSLALTVSKFRESFISSLVLFFLMVIKLQYMHKSIFLTQQSSSMSEKLTIFRQCSQIVIYILVDTVIYISLSRKNQLMNNRRSKLDCISIYSRIKKLIICKGALGGVPEHTRRQ